VPDPQFGAFIYFWSFFLIGQALWFGRGLIEDLARVRVYGPLFVTGSILAVFLNGWTSNTIAFQLGAAASTMMLIFGLVGATHALLNKPSRLVRFAARASYPVYIVHVWPAIGITIALLNVGMESTIAVICSTVLAITASLAVYVLLVRYTPLDWLFSGYAKSWFKWPWRQNGWP
jgi:peptidoglycan/LPS O-acetylase OafA/YrhL